MKLVLQVGWDSPLGRCGLGYNMVRAWIRQASRRGEMS
jgi:hypothetical protein